MVARDPSCLVFESLRARLLAIAVALAALMPAAAAAATLTLGPNAGSDTSDGTLVLANVAADEGIRDGYVATTALDPAVYQEFTFAAPPFPPQVYLTSASLHFNFLEKGLSGAVLRVWEEESGAFVDLPVDTLATDNAEITVDPSLLSFIDVPADAAAVKVRFAATRTGGATAGTDQIELRLGYDGDAIPPSAVWATPAAGSLHAAAIPLAASVADSGGAGIKSVTFAWAVAGSLGPWTTIATLAAAPFASTWTPPMDGAYDLQVTAVDRAGNSVSSAVAVVSFNRPPLFVDLRPAPLSSSATNPPVVAVDVLDMADGIDRPSLTLVVNGSDRTAAATISTIPGGYRMSLALPSPLPDGAVAAIEARAADRLGNAASRVWTFYTDMRYAAGTIVLDVTHTTSSAQQIYDAYGLAARLAGQGIEVDWVIEQAKSYGGVDFTATVDDAPVGATPAADGAVISKSYRAGPFVIRDPDPATAYNEAWDAIQSLASYGYAPNGDEIRVAVQVPRTNVMFLTYRPAIAVADNLAKAEADLARFPYTEVVSPGTTSDVTTVAGGGLFLPTSDPLCGRQRRFDLFIQGHYDWTNPNSSQRAAVGEIDQFIAKAGMGIFECLSATIENNAHWVTEPGSPAIEGAAAAADYSPDPARLGHPFLQTMDPIPIAGGGFSIWDRTRNRFRPSLQNILFDPLNLDIGYVFGAVGSGKAYFMGGHQRQKLSDRRLVLDAFLYNVVYPKYDRIFVPARIVAGRDNLITVKVRVRGGSSSLGTVVSDRLDAYSTLVAGSVTLLVPGAAYAWDPVSRTVIFDLGDLHPHDFPGGELGSYQVVVHPPNEGMVKVLDHTTTYRDTWGASYRYDSTGCGDVEALPMLAVGKTVSQVEVLAGVATRLRLRLVARNNHALSPIHAVKIEDVLPAGVSFVPGSIDTAKGEADWGLTTPGKLTWRVGVLVPSEEAVLTFDVDATPTAPGAFTVNTGASATGLDSRGEPLAGASGAVAVRAHPAADPVLDFALAPGLVAPGEPATYRFTATNIGAAKSFKAGIDTLVLVLPAEFGRPSRITTPGASWTAEWDATLRTLTFKNDASLSWTTGLALDFGFDLRAPLPPVDYPFDAVGTINSGAASYSERLPVAVSRIPGVILAPDGALTAEPCELAAYPHEVSNTSNGSDVFNLTGSSPGGLAVTYYRDDDLSGTLTTGDSVLGDSDGDGRPDTDGLLAGETYHLLFVVEVPNRGAPEVDTELLEARSAFDPAVMAAVTDVTSNTGLMPIIQPRAPEICAGAAITLDAGGGLASHSWSNGETARTVSVAPPATTRYTVDVLNRWGCAAQASETVVVRPLPLPAITPPTAEICAGQSVSLDAGAGFGAYAWSTGETARTIAVAPLVTTSYDVRVTDGFGCAGEARATVSVRNGPTPLIARAAGAVCASSVVTLDAGPGYRSYVWSTGERSQSITVNPLQSTTYEVTVVDALGCSGRTSASVDVSPLPAPEIAVSAGSVCAGEPVVLDAGPGFAWYLWSTGERTQTITVYPAVTTVYTVSVTSDAGCDGFATAAVVVDPPPQPRIDAATTTVCAGGSVTLDAGQGYAAYRWSTGETTRTIVVAPAASTTYTVTVTSASGCDGVASAEVTVQPLPAAVAGPGFTICPGGSVRLGVDPAPGYSYRWSPALGLDDPAAARPLASPDRTTAYTLTVTDPASGCSAEASAVVTVRASRPEVEVGNVLLETKAGGGRDVLHHWSEIAPATEYDLVRSDARDFAGSRLLVTVPAGTARHLETGAVDDGVTIHHYRLGGGACAPLPQP